MVEKMVVIELPDTYLVAYDSDPAEWVAQFCESADFSAKQWAERMVQLANARFEEEAHCDVING